MNAFFSPTSTSYINSILRESALQGQVAARPASKRFTLMNNSQYTAYAYMVLVIHAGLHVDDKYSGIFYTG